MSEQIKNKRVRQPGAGHLHALTVCLLVGCVLMAVPAVRAQNTVQLAKNVFMEDGASIDHWDGYPPANVLPYVGDSYGTGNQCWKSALFPIPMSIYGVDSNVFTISWNGQDTSGLARLSGGVRPGFVLGGECYTKVSMAIPPIAWLIQWTNTTSHVLEFSHTASHASTTWTPVAGWSSTAVPSSRAGDTVNPVVIFTSLIGGPANPYIDTVYARAGIPQLELDHTPGTTITFPDTAGGSYSETNIGVRNIGASDTVLYGANIVNAGDLTSSSWNKTAWKITDDGGGVFSVVSGTETLTAAQGGGWVYGTLRFTPSGTATYTGTVRIATTDPTNRYGSVDTIHDTIQYEEFTLVGSGSGGGAGFVAPSSSGSEATTPALIPVALSRQFGVTVIVDYEVAGGTATGGFDYTLASGQLFFNPGDLTQNISMVVNEDSRDEENETVSVILTDCTGAILTAATNHIYTITDNDDPSDVTFSGWPYEVVEDQGSINISVSVNPIPGKGCQINYATSDGDAIQGQDYTNTSGTLTWTKDESGAKSFSVPIINDTDVEGDHSFSVTLSGAVDCTVTGVNPRVVVIKDDDGGSPAVRTAAATAIGTNSATIHGDLLTLGGATTYVWFYWGDNDGGTNKATWDNNVYMGDTSAGPFQTGLSSLTQNTPYYFNTYASNANGGVWAVGTSSNFITGPPKIEFTATSSSGNEVTTPVNLEVRIKDPAVYGAPVQVSFSRFFLGSTALGGGVDFDFLTASPLTIPPGSTTANITLSINDDNIDENDELARIRLTSPVNATLGTQTIHGYTIIDNDNPPAASYITPFSGNEDSGQIPVTVTLSAPSAKSVSCDYFTSNGIAVAGVGLDYEATSGTLNWSAGETQKTFYVTIYDDSIGEGSQYFYVHLNNFTECSGGIITETVTIIDDDVTAPQVNNSGGAANISWGSAELSGTVVTANPPAFVYVYWGKTDGGTNKGAWDGVTYLGVERGDFTALAERLYPSTDYYYRCYGSNHVGIWTGEGWAPGTAQFTTDPPSNSGVVNYYVNDSDQTDDAYCTAVGNSVNSGLTPAVPKDSVADIVSTYDLDPGDVIWIDTGDYSIYPRITWDASDSGAAGNPVVFRGSPKRKGTVLESNGYTSSSYAGFYMSGKGDYVRFEQLAFTNVYCIAYVYSSSSTSPRRGIDFIKCDVMTANYGLAYGYNFADSIIEDNTVVSSKYYGLWLRSSGTSNVVVQGNTMQNCWWSTSGRGIFVDAGKDIVIDGNTCFDCAFVGIEIGAQKSVVLNNTCYDNGKDGINIAAVANCMIISNTVYRNNQYGLHFNGGYETFRHNAVFSNALYNFYSSKTDNHDMTIEQNTVYGGSGFFFTRPDQVSFNHNIVWSKGAGNLGLDVAYAPPNFRFISDYNDIYATEGAEIADWGGTACPTFGDWQITSSNDLNSVSADPKFVAGDQEIPDMHLQSTVASYHNGQWLSDPVDSPCIDAGDPEVAFMEEPWYNGLMRNIGAYGDTPEASQTYYDGPFFTLDFSVEPTNTVGSVDVWPPSDLYPDDREIRVTVVETYPNANPFLYWTNDWSGTNLVTEFFATDHVAATAVFSVPTITASADPGGTIDPIGSLMVVGGTNVTYTLTVTNGTYALTNLVVDSQLVGSNSVWTFVNVTNSHTIHGLFAEVSNPTIYSSAGPGGMIIPEGAIEVIGATNVTFDIAPTNSSFYITNLVVDSALEGSNNTWTFNSVIDDHTIHALFGEIVYPVITASAGAGGSISPSGDVTVVGATNVTFTITPDVDYYITNLLVDSVLEGSNTVWTFPSVTVDHTIHALFGTDVAAATTNGTPIPWLEFHGFTTDHQAADDADQDGDGFLTWQEFILGTDPNNGESLFEIYSLISEGVWVVTFPSIEATGIGYGAPETDERRYCVEQCNDLLAPSWVPVPDPNYTNILGDGSYVVYTNNTSRLYYRARARLE